VNYSRHAVNTVEC